MRWSFSAIASWLNHHQHISSWLQTTLIVVTLIFGIFQIRESTNANEIALKGRVSNIIMRINESLIGRDEKEYEKMSPATSKNQRIHLMRLEYFFQTHELYIQDIIDNDRLAAEENYLKWVSELTEFRKTWEEFGNQYPTPFRQWVCKTTNTSSSEPCAAFIQ